MQTWRGVHCALEKNILLKKVGTLSGDAGDVQEIRVLSRVLRWTAWRLAYEADPRHAELLSQACGSSASLRTTPGLKPISCAPGDESLLSGAEARLYRACAARGNYLALDRVDVAFAAKELCRRMSSPVLADWRFSSGWPSTSWEYHAESGILHGSRSQHFTPVWVRTTPGAM